MTLEVDYLELVPGHLDEVVTVMERMRRDHKGWVNFEPAVDLDDVPAESGVFSLFSARGPAVPLGTWAPPSAPRRGRSDPAQLGLQHGVGAKVKARLAEQGHPVPEGWLVVQDYAKKGLVVSLPPEAASVDVVEWLLGAAALLSTARLTGEWRAAVYAG